MKEAHNLEFKREWKDDLLKWISAFANAQGGTLIVGVHDDGQAVGVPQASKLLEDIPNKVRDVLGIVAEVNLVPRQGQNTLEIRVPAFAYPVSYKGSYQPFNRIWAQGPDRYRTGTVRNAERAPY